MNWRRLYPVRFDFFTAESFGSSEAIPAAGFRERSAVVLQAVERLHGIISSTPRQNRNREFSLQPSNLKTAIQPRMDTDKHGWGGRYCLYPLGEPPIWENLQISR